MTDLSREEMEKARDVGATVYLSAYVHLMGHHLHIADPTKEAFNTIAELMVDPLNLATEATWRAIMGDQEGCDQVMAQLKAGLEKLKPEE